MRLEIRPAELSDHAFVASLVPELQSGDPPPSLERFEQRMLADLRIAWVDGQAAGYIYRQLLDGTTYVRHVVVAAEQRGKGVGRALMEAVRAEAAAAGCTQWRLNVKPQNTPAVELYRSVGMRVVHESVALRFDWGLETQLPTAPRNVELRKLDALPVDEISTLEQAFDLPTGQLIAYLGAPGVHVRGLRGEGEGEDGWLGVLSFDTDFPGCFPFHLRDASDVGAVLTALRPLATKPNMGLVVEGHEALADLLIQAGARVQIRFVHMVGALTAS